MMTVKKRKRAPSKSSSTVLSPVLGCEIGTGDCRSLLSSLCGVEEVDLCFADPPFNIGQKYSGWDDTRSDEQYAAWTYEWMSCVYAALRVGGTVCIHISDSHVRLILNAAYTLGLIQFNWIIWHYGFGQCGFGKFINSHAHLLCFVKPPVATRTWNVEPVLVPSERLKTGDKRVTSSRYRGYRPLLDVWSGPNLGRIQGNNKERRKGHPNQLPELYVARVIRSMSNVGDVVLDPFVGSGTTPTVAMALGRRFVGCEISPASACSAAERVCLGPVRDVNWEAV